MERLHETNGALSSAEITTAFNVTVQTIRKDLNELSEKGLVRRVHGGICLPSDNHNLSFDNRTVLNLSAKQKIARKAVEFGTRLRDGRIGSGHLRSGIVRCIRKVHLHALLEDDALLQNLDFAGGRNRHRRGAKFLDFALESGCNPRSRR